MEKLLLATGNQGKIREYRLLLDGIPYNIVSPAEEGISAEVEETGGSYAENAGLKALALARRSRLIALADDSGLEVDALDGEPGCLSARYAGEGASDTDRLNFMLARLKDVPWERRTARFRSVIAIATLGGEVKFCCGECRGLITFAPRGEEGFGYDPIFYLPELDKTMAELPLASKNRISHRGQAARKACQVLLEMWRAQ